MKLRGRPIAFFLPTLRAAGAERATVKLAAFLLEALDVPVDIVLRRAEGELLSLLDSKVRVIELGTKRMSTSLLPLARYLRREKPHALVAHITHSNFVAALAHRCARSSAHLILVEHHDPTTGDLELKVGSRWLNLFLRRTLYPWADEVVAVSEGCAEALHREKAVRSPVTIYNPVVDAALERAAKEACPHPWASQRSTPIVLGVGRLVPQKNFALLIRAFRRLSERIDCRLMLLGEGPDRPRLAALVEELGISDRFTFAGAVTNPYPYFRIASVVALSSRYEGLPTVLIEAMALGRSVVAVDCPHGPREILDGGRVGSLVPLDDELGFSRAIEKAILEPQEEETLRARANQFSTVQSGESYLKILRLPYAFG